MDAKVQIEKEIKEMHPQTLNMGEEQPRLIYIVQFKQGTFNMVVIHPKTQKI